MSDCDEPISKRLRRRRSAHKAETSTNEKNRKSNKSSQKTSPNSLLLLNDDCLRKLFEFLDVIDLCNMANVCKRFRPITEEVFSRRHKKLVYKGQQCKNSDFRRVIYKFGHMITSIDASQARLADYRRKLDASFIAKYCTSENFNTIILYRAIIDCTAFRPLFSGLKCIELLECDFTGQKSYLFRNCPHLETFTFYGDFFSPDPSNYHRERSIDFVARRFPKLINLGFNCNYIAFHTFFDLLALNPQVKQIDISAQSEDMFIDAIAMCTKNLEGFALHSGDSLPEEQSRRKFLKLSKLKKLQKLKLDAGYEIYGRSVGPLMDAFDREKVPLSNLDLYQFSIGPNDIKSILKLKTIKFLVLNEIVKAVSDADLVPLATQLPLLEFLQLDFGKKVKTPITVSGLAKMAEDGKLIHSILLFGVQNLKIDQTAFEDILNAVRSRPNGNKLTIKIVGRYIFDVPENVQRAASAHLKFIHFSQ